MPRFLSPFRHRDREAEHIDPNYHDYHSLRPPTPSSGSQRNSFSPTSRHRDAVYVNGREEEYVTSPSNIHSYSGVLAGRQNRADGYSDTSFTDSDVRYARHRSRTHQTHVSDPMPYVGRLPSQESFQAPRQSRLYPVQVSSERPPTPGYHNLPATPVSRVSEPELSHTRNMPVISEEPQRIYAKPGETITINGVQIEFQGERRARHHRNYSVRGHSKARYTDDYISDGYSTSASFEDQPIIIKADPRTEIQIGNEWDGYVPYHQSYEPNKRRHQKSSSHQHRRSHISEEVYVVPAGANVIFVDEDGRELHRVGDFDEGKYARRKSSRMRANREVDGSYVIDL